MTLHRFGRIDTPTATASTAEVSLPKTHPKKPASGVRQERRSPVKSTSTVTSLTHHPGSIVTSLTHHPTSVVTSLSHQPTSGVTSVADVCNASKKKIDSLLKELVTLKQEKLGYLEEIAAVQSRVAARNQEIERLQHMLELAHNTAGKCLLNCCKERCCCNANANSAGNRSSYLEAQLREQLTECQELQHEAMCRAVKLAERNAQLEEQLINRRSAGETNCKCATDDQNTVRKLQEKLDCKILEIEELESKLIDLQKSN
ncbi:uncharacterized protein LOC120355127 [Nilaparvata lugens]|uniref:uncharacterized protein LOC120355127 n=1 Tax=Nilaparvata lugens TaxID=108931 RepID=UPI00193E1255|nr:uncharacterized protein LOC120355127 [Nilaparvata lugens]